MFSTIYGHGTHLFNGAEPFEQIVNTLSTESPMPNLVKIAQVVSDKKIFKIDGDCGAILDF